MPGAIHHSVVVVRDLESGLRFYRDGIGLDVLQDREVEGDWPALFDGPSQALASCVPRAIAKSQTSMPVFWNSSRSSKATWSQADAGPPSAGLFQLSFFVDVETTLTKLADLGLGGTPRGSRSRHRTG